MRNGIARPARDVANPDWRTSALQGRTRRVPSRFACTRNFFPGRAAGRDRDCLAAGPAERPRGRATCPPGQPPLSDCLISAEHGGIGPDLRPGQMTPTTASFAEQARHFGKSASPCRRPVQLSRRISPPENCVLTRDAVFGPLQRISQCRANALPPLHNALLARWQHQPWPHARIIRHIAKVLSGAIEGKSRP